MKRFLRREEGQGLVEYGLILLLVALVAMAGLPPIANAIWPIFMQVAAAL